MEFLSNNTCLVFENNPSVGGRMRIVQQDSSNFCACQNIGSLPGRTNLVRLSSDHPCSSSIPLLVRMLMHQIGFYAMNVRPDVDTYMSVNASIIKNTLQFDASLHTSKNPFANTFISRMPPFEFGSILTYGPSEFTFDETKPVFVVKPAYELFKYSMGSQRVTFGDIRMINNYYCSSSCAGKGTLKCANSGYQNPADCTKCLCPEEFGGPLCSDIARICDFIAVYQFSVSISIRYNEYNPTGSKADRTQGIILNATEKWQKKFIEFGQPASVGIRDEPMNRVDWIQAPSGQKIEVYMSDHTAQCNPGCYTGGVEIKYQDVAVAGPRFCCDEHLNKTLTSTLNPTPIISYNRYFFTAFWIKYRAVP